MKIKIKKSHIEIFIFLSILIFGTIFIFNYFREIRFQEMVRQRNAYCAQFSEKLREKNQSCNCFYEHVNPEGMLREAEILCTCECNVNGTIQRIGIVQVE
ncbi:MAG: hypothetical protein OH319_00990 [Candidatus Parvarchaeota archaeon]|nr:hypothetical protein [Candidatus Jingweiarchaeum tengchongense]MCW1297850.1 hypothetical protein [Candidatus Jingweiarchaeum tengchongense]MCW1299861.1 hypothetical protein [Candidatus Jingweiarchaeum tengchongense]MCW1304169.1 hypothetical protein [Candidatus Jingweiarchaeum tengchongense]MCW1305197.1 hypothetical protein [Candidatus Jingweiarchaeum tengchongense]